MFCKQVAFYKQNSPVSFLKGRRKTEPTRRCPLHEKVAYSSGTFTLEPLGAPVCEVKDDVIKSYIASSRYQTVLKS